MHRRRFAAVVFGAAIAPLLGAGAASATLPPLNPRRISYMVFFNFDLTEISSQGHTTLQQVARAFKGGSSCEPCEGGEWAGQLFLCSHTDLAEASMALSTSRGEAVLQRLALLGVPNDRMVVLAYGATKPLVPTRPGVREPQNRRVEILFNRPS